MFPTTKNVACVKKFDTFCTPQFPINISAGFKLVVKIIVV